MKKRSMDQDRLVIKQKKGTWKRFIKLFPKCRLPWVWLTFYIILQLGVINIGLSETDYTAQLFAGDTSAALLAQLVGVILLNMVGTNIALLTEQVTTARINRNMRGVVLDKVMRLPMSFFKDENPRDAIYRIVRNSIVINSTIMSFIVPIAMAAYTAVAIFSRVFQYDWRLSIILLGFIPVQLFIAFIFGRLNYSVSERNAYINASLTQRLAELVTNIPLAKAFVKEKKETEKGEELTSRLYKVSIKSSWLDQFKDLSTTFLDLAQSVIIVLVGVLLLGTGTIEKKAWISFFLFSSVFSGAVNDFMMYWNNIKIIQGGAEKVAEIIDAPEEDRSGEPCGELKGDIVLEHINFGYEEDKTVLSDVSCTFKDNKVTALLGVSGCGKTTLVNLLTRLYEPKSGTISIRDKSIHGYALDDYRSNFVMVSQNGMLFSGTIRENVCYGNDDASEEALVEALKKAGAYDFIEDFPDGVDTPLEEYGQNLSGGQRQRLTVARALLSKAHYIILDEPAASMDAIAVADIMRIFKELSKDRCVVIIAHSKAVLNIADHVIILENGIAAAEGATSEVINANNFLREFAGSEVTDNE